MKQFLLIIFLSLTIFCFNAFAEPDPAADLAAAVQACDIDFLKIAIDNGADPNDGSKMDNMGTYNYPYSVPIFYSVKYCPYEFLKAHIEAGADLKWEQPTDNASFTPTIINVFDSISCGLKGSLEGCDIEDATDRVILLLRNGADPNPASSKPPLLNVNLIQSKVMIDTLLSYGANINAKFKVNGFERGLLSLFLEAHPELYRNNGFKLMHYLLEVGAPAESDNLYYLMKSAQAILDGTLTREELKAAIIDLLSATENFLVTFPEQKFDFVDSDNYNAFALILGYCDEIEDILGETSVEARYCHRIKDAIEPRM